VTGILKQKNPANILLVLVCGILIKLPMFSGQPHPVTGEGDTMLYHSIASFLVSAASPATLSVITFLLIFLQAMLLNRLINENRMIQKQTYLPAMSYMVVTSLLPEWNVFSAPMLSNTFIIFIFFMLFKTYNKDRAKGAIYNIGLALGIAGFIYSPSLVFLLWVLPGLLVMRSVRLNEWLICIMGILTPYYLHAAYLLIFDAQNWEKIIPEFSFTVPDLQQSFWLAGSVLLLVVPFLVGGYFVQVNLRRMLIQVRKDWSLVLIYLLLSVAVPFLSRQQYLYGLMLCVIPFASFQGSAWFYPKANWFSALLFWVTVLFIIAYQYGGPGWTI
jgi:hypothetical protein